MQFVMWKRHRRDTFNQTWRLKMRGDGKTILRLLAWATEMLTIPLLKMGMAREQTLGEDDECS